MTFRQLILLLSLGVLRGCSVGTTDERDLLGTPLKLNQVAWYMYQFRRRLVKEFKHYYVSVSEIWEAAMFVLLMEWICELCRWDGLSWHDTHITFHKDKLAIQMLIGEYIHI
jgi:hypothetical protein